MIGKSLRVNRLQLTVIGVAPPRFHGTMPGLMFHIWVPATMGKDLGPLEEGAFRLRSWRAAGNLGSNDGVALRVIGSSPEAALQ